MTEERSLEELAQALRGYQESRALLTAIELDLFAALGEGATAPEAAERAGTNARATSMLLDALVSLGALSKEDGIYRCTEGSRAFAHSRAEFLHSVRKWDTWSTLTECVRTGVTTRTPGRREADGLEAFIGAMHARALLVADRLVTTVGASGSHRLLDLGGGAGTFALAFAQANPLLHADVLDRPDVVPITQRQIRAAGLSDRVAARAGDLRSDAFGEGYDLLLASAVCHMFDETGNQDFLRRCARALVPGGRLVIRDFLLDPDRTGPREAALFALNMLVSTARGNVYTEAQYRFWLKDAGFGPIERHRHGEDLLIARLPHSS